MNETKNKLIFSVKISDCRVETFRGSGKGGQNRNKRDTAVRITHLASGAVGQAQDERSQWQNKKLAFRRMAETNTFQNWCRVEAARVTGELENIKRKIENELRNNVKTEILINERWTELDVNRKIQAPNYQCPRCAESVAPAFDHYYCENCKQYFIHAVDGGYPHND